MAAHNSQVAAISSTHKSPERSRRSADLCFSGEDPVGQRLEGQKTLIDAIGKPRFTTSRLISTRATPRMLDENKSYGSSCVPSRLDVQRLKYRGARSHSRQKSDQAE